MNNLFKNVLKAGALFFAVGCALALVAPPLATFLGAGVIGEAALAHAVSTPVLWTGAFFGAFGAIDAGFRPVFDWLFGDKAKEGAAPAAKDVGKDASPAKQVNITIVQSPQQSQAVVENKHQQEVKAKRLLMVLSGGQSPNA